MKVTKEQFDNWMKALRSGEYKQVKGTLKGYTEDDEEGYCCLGVFESINGREPNLEVENEDEEIYEGPRETYGYLRDYLGSEVVYCGIEMNDSGKTFLKIADNLEKIYYESYHGAKD